MYFKKACLCFHLPQILLKWYIITENLVVKCIKNWEDTIQNGDVDHGNNKFTVIEWVSFSPTWVALVSFLIFISYLFKL